MATNIGLRIFRRNTKNCIFLWNSELLPDDNKLSVAAFIIDGEGDRALEFTTFRPDNPEKFSPGVAGIVISHAANKIDPTKPCTIKVLFGEGDDSFEVEKTVLPANSAPEAQDRETGLPRIIHMYGMDYRTNKWVPFPVNPEHMVEE
jgi:hypothetical protein